MQTADDANTAAECFARVLFQQRLRTPEDVWAVTKLLEAHKFSPANSPKPASSISAHSLQIGQAIIQRSAAGDALLLSFEASESSSICVPCPFVVCKKLALA